MHDYFQKDDTLRNEAVNRIKKLIVVHNLKPGDKLPTERRMSEEFGVSRTVIRDAVKTLAGLGILEVRHRVGIFVADVNSRTIARHLSSLFVLNEHRVKSLYQVRLVIETAAAGWAAESCDEDGMKELNELMEDTAKCLVKENKQACFGELDRNFHLLIAKISQNPFIFDLMNNLLIYLEVTSRYTHSIPGRVERSAREHEIIVQAIRNRKPETARDAMYQHLDSVFQSVTVSWENFQETMTRWDT